MEVKLVVCDDVVFAMKLGFVIFEGEIIGCGFSEIPPRLSVRFPQNSVFNGLLTRLHVQSYIIFLAEKLPLLLKKCMIVRIAVPVYCWHTHKYMLLYENVHAYVRGAYYMCDRYVCSIDPHTFMSVRRPARVDSIPFSQYPIAPLLVPNRRKGVTHL